MFFLYLGIKEKEWQEFSDNGCSIMSAINVRGLSYKINQNTILEEVSFNAGSAELIGLVGPNGSGKTTLLRVLGGILKPSEGCVYINSRDIYAIPDRERAKLVSYMPQVFYSDFNLSVKELVLMGRYPYRSRLERFTLEDEEKSLRMIEYVGMSELVNRPFNKLSGGEKQLALLAKVLTQETDIILLDEPTSNLDINHQDRIFSILYELSREGKTLITAVHNLNIASRYCSRIIMLSDGKIERDGDVGEVVEPGIIEKVYGVRALVAPDPSTGFLNVNVMPKQFGRRFPKVHLIGGAGSAINLTRELFRTGFEITGGIAHNFDSDLTLWNNLEIENVSVEAFSTITDRDIQIARRLVERADVTILCEFPIGPGNVGNLKLARFARRLIIIEDKNAPLHRSFYDREAKILFEELLKGAEILSYGEVLTLFV